MPTDPSDITGIAALGEPVRRRLYDVVAAAPDPIGRELAASLAGVAAHTARFHLDRLVDEGLLEIEFRRLTGRTGPGSGRPAKLYRRGSRELSVSMPPRDYDLLSRILANAVARAPDSTKPVATIAAQIARTEGAAFGTAVDIDGNELDRITGALSAGGYEPRQQDDEVRVHNCPFHRAAQEQTELVCSLNLAYVTGICEGLACTSVTPTLEPSQDNCCVVVRTLPAPLD
jgi:predicted ArsR family transcriptional regulator